MKKITQKEYDNLRVLDALNWDLTLEYNKKTGELMAEHYFGEEWPEQVPYFRSDMLIKMEIKEYWKGEIHVKETEYFWDEENFNMWSDMIKWAGKQGVKI